MPVFPALCSRKNVHARDGPPGPSIIIREAKDRITPRIERWGIRLQVYDYCIGHRPAGDNKPADYISRPPTNHRESPRGRDADYLCYFTEQALPPTLTIEDIATQADPSTRWARMLTIANKWKDYKRLSPQRERVNRKDLNTW